jgi:spore coat protein U-like protein
VINITKDLCLAIGTSLFYSQQKQGMMSIKIVHGVLALSVLASTSAYAACSIVGVSKQDFGAVSSQNNVINQQIAEITVSCDTAYQLGIDAGTNYAGSRQLAQGGARIPYTLYQNATTTEWGSQNISAANTYPQPSLSSGGGANITHRIYASASSQNKAPEGHYTDSVNLILADSAGGAIGSPTILNFDLNLVGACSIDTSGFGSFGYYPLGNPAVTDIALGSISVTCPTSIPYKVGLDAGQNLNANSRRMALEGTHFIPYRLKHNGNEWGDGGLQAIAADYAETYPFAAAVSGTGTGSVQTFNVSGDADISQATAAGTYSDKVIVTLTW